MMHVQASLGGRGDGEFSLNHCGGLVKLVQAFFLSRKDRGSNFHHRGDARAGLLKWQERSRKQFSRQLRCCKARAGLFKCQGRLSPLAFS